MLEGVAKLFQRQVYSWLSSKCGLPICIVGVLLAIISAFQFGEVFLEWSKERYAARFTVYGDNVGGRSYERYMCPELPIDIVYTWVNGSDPKLIAELRALHRKMARKSSQSVNAAANSSQANDTSAEPKCPFKHCVPWRCVILDGRNHSELSLETIRSFSPLLGTAWDSQYINSTGNHMTPIHAVRMPAEEDVSSVLKGIIRDSEGRNISATRGFLTSNGNLLGAVKMADFAILISDGFGLANNSGLIRRWSQIQFKRNISEAAVKASGVAVAGFKPGVLQHILKHNKTYQFSGQPVKIHQAYLIWLPFSLPNSENNTESKIKGDIISENRFQDNEELRYSLRSVEQHAPWVRHIFIVTNGQIPSWLNLDAPRVTLVTHDEIFLNSSHLPTYSSPAIETHLHRIPGLSKRFIYLNDDVMFGADVWPEDFYTPQKGQKVYLSWPVPHCAEGCPPNWIRDHYCDTACNNSACDWDAGDCENATRPGWQPGHFWHRTDRGNMDYCNTGCINSWLGDRYCDMSCRVADCGYDAGDCGTEHWEELYSIEVDSSGGNYVVPLETTAMYFNLTSLFFNGTISSAEYTPSPLIRTAVVAQKFKTLSITFNKNITRSTANISIAGINVNGTKFTVSFNLTGDTATRNKTVVRKTEYFPHWSFPNFTDTQSWQFLRTVAVKIQNANHSINYWVAERPSPSHTPPPPTTYTNYTVTNMSALSENVSQALKSLEKEYREGDLTEKGYLKRKSKLLEPFRHLMFMNGSREGGSNRTTPTVAADQHRVKGGGRRGGGGGGEGQEGHAVNGHRSLSHVELFDAARGGGVGGRRRLMVYEERGVSDEEWEMAEWVAKGKQKELTWEQDLHRALQDWELNHGPWDPHHVPWESRRRLPWEKYRVFPESAGVDAYTPDPHIGRRLMDTFGDSLRHVNRLYTKAYGNQARKVPAHMPHMINQEVMRALHERYPEEFDHTSSHKIRSSDDMQFSFSYFYFLMGERQKMDLERAFGQLDTDKSGILSVRELRTLLAKISDLPIDLKAVHKFEDLLRKCDREYNGTRPSVDPVEFETHYDPDLPLVTLDFTRHCRPLMEKLNSTFKSKPMYRYEEVGEEEVTFKMISENASKVMQQLDEIRRDRKKFICLNDNIDHQKEGADLAKLILLDFYESLYPTPSQFELSPQYRNRFLHTHELNEWLVFRGQIQTVLHVACALLLVMCVVSLFYGKIMQLKRRLSRLVASLFHMERTRTPTV